MARFVYTICKCIIYFLPNFEQDRAKKRTACGDESDRGKSARLQQQIGRVTAGDWLLFFDDLANNPPQLFGRSVSVGETQLAGFEI